jgi:predicted amidohydrolase YtcJ
VTGAVCIIRGRSVAGWPDADSVLVRDGRFARIGALRELRDEEPSAPVDDVGGHLVPGLTDGHAHPVFGARLARGVDLRGVHDLADLAAALRAGLAQLPRGEWLLGWGLQHSVFAGDPDRRVVDEVAPDTPALLRMFDAHSVLANRAALTAAGITGPRSFPSGSHVATDAHGDPTGLLVEVEAIEIAERLVPPEPAGATGRRLADMLAQMRRSGLTGLHVMDMEGAPDDLYAALDDAGELALRIKAHPWVMPDSTEAHWSELRALHGRGGRLWRRQGVKFFLDGTVDNGTAWLSEPDRDGKSVRASWTDVDAYTRAVATFARAGIPTATHAIGDAAVRGVAEAIAAARRLAPEVPHRIEHLEVMDDATLDVVAASGAFASVQPTHCTRFVHADGSDNWSQRLGERRHLGWRLGSLVARGVPIVLGSDWPIADYAPLEIIADAQVRRRAGAPGPVVGAGEAISAAVALLGYTEVAARASGVAHEEGRIAEGNLADLTVLGADPLTVDADALPEVAVLATAVGGDVSR